MSGTNDEASLATITVRAVDMGIKVGEMMVASAVVVTARTALIGAAMANPVEGDYRELGRMLPEKLFAMSCSGMALFDSLTAFQRDMAAQLTDLTLLAMGGVPTPDRLARLADDSNARGARALLWSIEAGDAAMAPMHRAVTSNARRLGAKAA